MGDASQQLEESLPGCYTWRTSLWSAASYGLVSVICLDCGLGADTSQMIKKRKHRQLLQLLLFNFFNDFELWDLQ